MTGFITNVTVSPVIGMICQIILILSNIVVISFYTIFLLRFRLIKEKAPLEKLYFYFITVNVFFETIRMLDPFSMNGIYSYEINRLFNFFSGGFLSTCLGIMISDTLSAILARIDNKGRSQSMRYITIISLIINTIGMNLCIIYILIYIFTDGDVTTKTPNAIFGKIGFIGGIIGVLCIIILIKNDIKNLKKQIQKTTTINIQFRAKKRLLFSLYLQLIFVVSIVVTFILEIIDGAYLVDKKNYFIWGLWYGIAFRLLPSVLLYTQWIGKPKLSDLRVLRYLIVIQCF